MDTELNDWEFAESDDLFSEVVTKSVQSTPKLKSSESEEGKQSPDTDEFNCETESCWLRLHTQMLPALTCPICEAIFDMPLTLACGHSFCYQCLLSLASGDGSINKIRTLHKPNAQVDAITLSIDPSRTFTCAEKTCSCVYSTVYLQTIRENQALEQVSTLVKHSFEQHQDRGLAVRMEGDLSLKQQQVGGALHQIQQSQVSKHNKMNNNDNTKNNNSNNLVIKDAIQHNHGKENYEGKQEEEAKQMSSITRQPKKKSASSTHATRNQNNNNSNNVHAAPKAKDKRRTRQRQAPVSGTTQIKQPGKQDPMECVSDDLHELFGPMAQSVRNAGEAVTTSLFKTLSWGLDTILDLDSAYDSSSDDDRAAYDNNQERRSRPTRSLSPSDDKVGGRDSRFSHMKHGPRPELMREKSNNNNNKLTEGPPPSPMPTTDMEVMAAFEV